MQDQALPHAMIPPTMEHEPVRPPSLPMPVLPTSLPMPVLPSLTLLAVDFWDDMLRGSVPALTEPMTHGLGLW